MPGMRRKGARRRCGDSRRNIEQRVGQQTKPGRTGQSREAADSEGLANHARGLVVIARRGHMRPRMRSRLTCQRHIDVRLHHEHLDRQRKRG